MLQFSINKKPADYEHEIAARHKIIRKQLKYSQSDLASRSGVSLGSLKRFETTGKISLESLLKMADVLNRLQDFEAIFKPINNLATIEKLFSDKTRK